MTLDVWCLTAGCHIVIPTQISPNLCTSLVTVQILMRAFRWLFFSLLFLVWGWCVATRCNQIHTCACVCTMHILCVCACVCTFVFAHKHIWLGLFVCSMVNVCGLVQLCLLCSKVSHLSRRWLRVANGRLDRWMHCSTLAAVASAQVTASPAQWWCQCWWVAGGLTTLFWWQNDSAVRFTTSLAFFRFVSLYWEV